MSTITTLIFTGTITSGVDPVGYFNPFTTTWTPNLTERTYYITWTGIDCECDGTTTFNPIISVDIYIDGGLHHPLGAGQGPNNKFYTDLQQVDNTITVFANETPVTITVSFMTLGPSGGQFFINCCNDPREETFAFLSPPTLVTYPVPAPLMGSGIPGLLLLGALLWRRLARD
jgi:hypothetical protein